MRPAEACDIGDAPDGRPVPVVWPSPAHVGNEKYLAGLWIIVASGPSVWRSSSPPRGRACNRKAGVRRNAASDDPHCADTGRTGRCRRAYQPNLGVRQSSATRPRRARRSGVGARLSKPLRCAAVTVTQPGGQRADRMFTHQRASGDHPHLSRSALNTGPSSPGWANPSRCQRSSGRDLLRERGGAAPGLRRAQPDGVTGDHMPNHCSAP